MFYNESQNDHKYFKKKLLHIKGQAIPLFSYHVIRDYILPNITGDYQSSILYWAGKDLAHKFNPSSCEELTDLFLELGWGYLSVQQTGKAYKFTLSSPYFDARQVTSNHETFGLECGFLTESLAFITHKNTEGSFKITQKKQDIIIIFTIHVEEKKETPPS